MVSFEKFNICWRYTTIAQVRTSGDLAYFLFNDTLKVYVLMGPPKVPNFSNVV